MRYFPANFWGLRTFPALYFPGGPLVILPPGTNPVVNYGGGLLVRQMLSKPATRRVAIQTTQLARAERRAKEEKVILAVARVWLENLLE